MLALARRILILATIAALLPLGAHAKGQVTVAGGVNLIVFRHADRSGPELNAAGIARAAALPAALGGQHIDAIYSPEIDRNIDTVLPLATSLGLEIQTISTFNMPDVLAGLPAGRTVVWVGNKDNLKRLWARISAPGEPPLNYGDLFIVTFDGGSPQVDRQHFGD